MPTCLHVITCLTCSIILQHQLTGRDIPSAKLKWGGGVHTGNPTLEINRQKLQWATKVLRHFAILEYLKTFALIVSAHPYCARKFTPRHRHVMHERTRAK